MINVFSYFFLFFFQVGLIIRVLINSVSLCGGSLISSNSIITAAHCYFDGIVTANDFTSVLGSNLLFSGGLRILTNDITVHPEYDVEMISNDIAIIKIPDITFSSKSNIEYSPKFNENDIKYTILFNVVFH